MALGQGNTRPYILGQNRRWHHKEKDASEPAITQNTKLTAPPLGSSQTGPTVWKWIMGMSLKWEVSLHLK